MQIIVRPFQPFESRVGIDTVLGLSFRYDAALIELLKSALRQAGARERVRNPGGWVREHKCWFVERAVWPAVRACLVRAGHEVVEHDPEPAGGAKGARRKATHPPPIDPLAVLRSWFAQMSQRWHPDRGGSDQAMAAVNDGYERLRKLLEAT
jgi:hypothetical protein